MNRGDTTTAWGHSRRPRGRPSRCERRTHEPRSWPTTPPRRRRSPASRVAPGRRAARPTRRTRPGRHAGCWPSLASRTHVRTVVRGDQVGARLRIAVVTAVAPHSRAAAGRCRRPESAGAPRSADRARPPGPAAGSRIRAVRRVVKHGDGSRMRPRHRRGRPLRELLTPIVQSRDESHHRGVVAPRHDVGANCESTRRASCSQLPINGARVRVGEHDPDEVAVSTSSSSTGEQRRERLVPRGSGPSAPRAIHRAGAASESSSRTTAGDGAVTPGRIGPRCGWPASAEQMVAFHVVESQARAARRHVGRGLIGRPVRAATCTNSPTHRRAGPPLRDAGRWCGGVGPRAGRRRRRRARAAAFRNSERSARLAMAAIAANPGGRAGYLCSQDGLALVRPPQPPCNAVMRVLPTSTIRDLLAVTEQPGMRSLAGGLPEPAVFPAERLARAAETVLGSPATASRRAPVRPYRRHTHAARDPRVGRRAPRPAAERPDASIVTTGSQQALDLVAARAARRRRHRSRSTTPAISAPNRRSSCRARSLVGVPHGRRRWDEVDAVEQRPRPARGRASCTRCRTSRIPPAPCSPRRGRACTRGARPSYGFVIVEDDAYHALWYDAPAARADRRARRRPRGVGRVVLEGARAGSARGLVAPPAWLREWPVRAKQACDLHTSTLAQASVADVFADESFVQRGSRGHPPNLASPKAHALAAALDGWGDGPTARGGMFLWRRVPGVDAGRCSSGRSSIRWPSCPAAGVRGRAAMERASPPLVRDLAGATSWRARPPRCASSSPGPPADPTISLGRTR